jgi:hypothetical protein
MHHALLSLNSLFGVCIQTVRRVTTSTREIGEQILVRNKSFMAFVGEFPDGSQNR